MPSHLHESHVLLFRNQPTLAAELIRETLHGVIPNYRHARIASGELTDIQPAEYRADLVIELHEDAPVFGIVLEVQLSTNERKRFVWPAYVANLRARLGCPVCLLVVTADEAEARANPELAVLSAMAHGGDADIERSARIATVAQLASADLDADRSTLYFDLIYHSLGEAARKALNTMQPRKYEYQSDFARRYFFQGEAKGRSTLILRLLALRFGELNTDVQDAVSNAQIPELDAIGERLLTAKSLDEALAR